MDVGRGISLSLVEGCMDCIPLALLNVNVCDMFLLFSLSTLAGCDLMHSISDFNF